VPVSNRHIPAHSGTAASNVIPTNSVKIAAFTDLGYRISALAIARSPTRLSASVVTISRFNDATLHHPIQLSKNPVLLSAQKSQIANQKFSGLPPAHSFQRLHPPTLPA
jgi:hypothetical protein